MSWVLCSSQSCSPDVVKARTLLGAGPAGLLLLRHIFCGGAEAAAAASRSVFPPLSSDIKQCENQQFVQRRSLRPQEETEHVECFYVPKETVEVPVSHVLEHHGQRLSVGADAVETHNVLVLQHRQQLGLPLEVLPGRLVCILQSLPTNKGCN